MTERPPDPWEHPGAPGADHRPPPPPGAAGASQLAEPGGAEPTSWYGPPPPLMQYAPSPPSHRRRSKAPWILGGLLVVAVGAGVYVADRSDKDATRPTEVEEINDRVTRSVQEALAREPDVANSTGSRPKAMRISGGGSGTTFTVFVPPKWDGRLAGDTVVDSSIEAFLGTAPTEGFAPNIVIEVTNGDIGRTPLRRLVENAISSTARQLKNVKAGGDPRSTTVGGRKALAQDYTAQLPNGAPLSAQVVVTIHDGRAYYFYLSTLPSQRPAAQPVFTTFLRTVEFE